MLSYFKINDPFRLVPLLLLAFLLKLPTLLNPIAYPEATHWFVIGEAMQSNTMYIDIWDGLAPFSATIYMVFTWLLGRSIFWLLILGTLLTFFQAIIINNFSIKAKLFENNTYLPALVYVLISSSHAAFFTLSPILLGLTFILIGLGKLLSHVEFRATTDLPITMIGLYFGIAILFYLPYIVIIPIGLILLRLFSNTIIRRYFLLLFTSITPLLFAYFYYSLKSDHFVYFTNNFLLIAYFDAYYTNIGWLQGLKILSFALFFMMVGIVSFGKQRRLTNYQNRIAQLFILLGVLMFSLFLFEKPTTHYSLVIFIPIATIFTVHFIALFKKKRYSFLLGSLLFLLPPLLLWGISNTLIMETSTVPNTSSLEQYKKRINGKRAMVLGSAKELYKEAELAGPFYDWGLSQSFFKELDYYDNLIFLQKQLLSSNPEVIIDLENNWGEVSKRLPEIGSRYKLVQPNVWVKK